MSEDRRKDLGEAVRLLESKWSAYDGFYGYRIGHEDDPCGDDGGIYNSATYANMATVIDSIRAYDTEHRIIAVGNTLNTSAWTPTEQTAFRQSFFLPDTTNIRNSDPRPANIFMQEIYFLRPIDSTEVEVQTRFDLLRTGLDSIGTMVHTAHNNNRKAEWHFIANVGDQWKTQNQNDPCKHQILRAPTVAELNAQVNMALSRGATGITYFLYTSSDPNRCNSDGRRYDGLVTYDQSGQNRIPRQPIWNTVRTVNNTLRTLGDALNPLTWDAGFGSDHLSDKTLVDAVRLSANHAAAGRLEFGVFHDDEADYVLVVNRHNLRTGDSQTIDLRFDTQRMQSDLAQNGHYVVREIVTDVEDNYPADANGHIWITDQTLAPGDARLYRIAADTAPAFSFVPPRQMKSATVGLQYTFNRPNPSNGTGTITYVTTSTGSGLTATPTEISGTPTTAGSFDFVWTATDGSGATAIFTLTLNVRASTDPPAFDEDRVSHSVQAGSTFKTTLPDAEGASSYETSGPVPGYVEINTTTRAITIQPENTHVGDDDFIWRARNPHGTDDLTVDITVTAIPTVSAPGPVRNLSASGGSVSGSIAVSWDAPNTGGTPTLYRVEYRQGSAAWQAGGTTTQTSLSIGTLVGGSTYSIQVRAENRGGNSRWRSTTATATNGTQTQTAYRLHTSGTTAPTFTASASTVPTGWSSTRPTPNPYAPYVWRISRSRPTGGSWSNWGGATVVNTWTAATGRYRDGLQRRGPLYASHFRQ
jgi:hypothetical protein